MSLLLSDKVEAELVLTLRQAQVTLAAVNEALTSASAAVEETAGVLRVLLARTDAVVAKLDAAVEAVTGSGRA